MATCLQFILRAALILALASAVSAQAMCVRNMADRASLNIQLPTTGKRDLSMILQPSESYCSADHPTLTPDQAKQMLTLYVNVVKPAGSLGCAGKRNSCVAVCASPSGDFLLVPAGAQLTMDVYQRDSASGQLGQPFIEINPNNGRSPTTRVVCF
jgi:hypothetical protein